MPNHQQPTEPLETWEEALTQAGNAIRHDANANETPMQQTVARTYTLNRARRQLNLHKGTIEQAIANGHFTSFVDPEGNVRIPA